MKTPVKVSSISVMHQFLGLKRPANPLISVFNFDEVKLEPGNYSQRNNNRFLCNCSKEGLCRRKM